MDIREHSVTVKFRNDTNHDLVLKTNKLIEGKSCTDNHPPLTMVKGSSAEWKSKSVEKYIGTEGIVILRRVAIG
ncbi:hypothetical protein Xvie_04079 [Xenorhabdus vietnamensis]|uniref:Uncharacterized protein n=1 Tax=Xenorhabdus vietnamensis TaxID=351656 RepID=A0A1Y2S8Y4_9GAMM|nr:hypothetical protein [Xenorhabdus vietnamensis]OTA14000.1 hypothetical protein Xvie_04079 [Xenorhabdus vietnamensis]